MKLCFVNTSRAWGGGEKWHLEMARQLQAGSYDVSLIAAKGSKLASLARDSGLHVYHLPIGNLSFVSPWKRLKYKRLLKEIAPDVMIINAPSELKICSPINRKLGIKSVYRRGSAIPVRNTWLNRKIFRKNIDLILANSEQTRKTILRNNPQLFPEKSMAVIYNGIDLEKYDYQSITKENRAKEGKLIIGNAGRLVKQKAQFYLIELAVELKNKNIDFLIRIAGSGPLEKELKHKVSAHKLEDHFAFLGFVEDMKSFMFDMDIFVLTSLWEGFGYVLLEAMAAKKPIIAFDVSSNPELVKEGINGYLVKLGDIQGMVEKILLLKERDRAEEMGKNGREIAARNFELKVSVKALDRLLQEKFAD
ncbi:MAG: glycosyltransferase [Bacteroidales bacterium]|nr:glycosyltransferase [Bacteroidales bacterium]MCF8387067.1 glycosyltransferase [Bacteroidales bacterium]MCF8397753.1 glycosyltransferase [Bacteroidales bacterium]